MNLREKWQPTNLVMTENNVTLKELYDTTHQLIVYVDDVRISAFCDGGCRVQDRQIIQEDLAQLGNRDFTENVIWKRNSNPPTKLLTCKD